MRATLSHDRKMTFILLLFLIVKEPYAPAGTLPRMEIKTKIAGSTKAYIYGIYILYGRRFVVQQCTYIALV